MVGVGVAVGVGMGGALHPKLVWQEHGLPFFGCAIGVASDANLIKSWHGKGKVGVVTATPTIWHSPPMGVRVGQVVITIFQQTNCGTRYYYSVGC